MGLMSYNRVGSGKSSGSSSSSSSSSCTRGFKLNPRKFYVLRLRRRLRFFFFSLFHKCSISYSQAIRLLRRVFLKKTWSSRNNNYYRNSLAKEEQERIRKLGGGGGRVFYARSNSSFYSEAIADCLEFIKRTSVSMDDQSHHIQHSNT